jgi:hypothetical protein
LNAAKVARSHQLVHDFEAWLHVLAPRKEAEILRIAASEYQHALLALTLGLYRQAFKGLRLTLELSLQMIRLSAHEMELREWLQSRKDTIWDRLTDEEEGVFSFRFARAFFPQMEGHMKHHRALASQLYRECSECVHGNIPSHIPLPPALEFAQASFDLWHEKAAITAMLANLAFALRYVPELDKAAIGTLETLLLDRLGYIEELRGFLGGSRGG